MRYTKHAAAPMQLKILGSIFVCVQVGCLSQPEHRPMLSCTSISLLEFAVLKISLIAILYLTAGACGEVYNDY